MFIFWFWAWYYGYIRWKCLEELYGSCTIHVIVFKSKISFLLLCLFWNANLSLCVISILRSHFSITLISRLFMWNFSSGTSTHRKFHLLEGTSTHRKLHLLERSIVGTHKMHILPAHCPLRPHLPSPGVTTSCQASENSLCTISQSFPAAGLLKPILTHKPEVHYKADTTFIVAIFYLLIT